MRNLGLDILRFVAVLLVLGHHAAPGDDANVFMIMWSRGGWVGVDLFFVLSGYLVSGLLFAEHRSTGEIRPGRFLLRRGFKIYPAFWVMLAATVLVNGALGSPVSFRTVVKELLFVQNYFGGAWRHTWSLAVEEHFYFALAAGAWLATKGRRQHPFASVPLLFAVIAAACLGMRVWLAWNTAAFNPRTELFPTHLRIDALFLGVLLAYLAQYRGLLERLRPLPAWTLLMGGAVLLSPVFFVRLNLSAWMHTLGLTVFAAGSGLLLLAALRLNRSDTRVLRGFGRLGAASYSMYLWHWPVLFWGGLLWEKAIGPAHDTAFILSFISASIAAGLLMHRCVEVPVLRLRDRLFPRLAKI